MSAEEKDEEGDFKSPWDRLFVTLLTLGTAAWILTSFALDRRGVFPERTALTSSQGTIVAFEKLRGFGDTSYSLRLSDSERWYGPPAIGERVNTAVQNARGTPTVVTVLHEPEPSSPPADGSRWHVAAYAVTIGDREIIAYEQIRANHDEYENTEYWLGIALTAFGVLFAYWTYAAFRDDRAKRQNQ